MYPAFYFRRFGWTFSVISDHHKNKNHRFRCRVLLFSVLMVPMLFFLRAEPHWTSCSSYTSSLPISLHDARASLPLFFLVFINIFSSFLFRSCRPQPTVQVCTVPGSAVPEQWHLCARRNWILPLHVSVWVQGDYLHLPAKFPAAVKCGLWMDLV